MRRFFDKLASVTNLQECGCNIMRRLLLIVAAITVSACQQPAPPVASDTGSGKPFDVIFAGGSIVD